MFRTNYVADECKHKVCAADNNQHYRRPTAIARKQIAQIFDLREEFHLIKRRDDKAQERYDRARVNPILFPVEIAIIDKMKLTAIAT